MTIRLPSTCLVVLVGPVASGKSTWAAEQFGSDQIVSADRLRGVVGEGEHDQRASKDAFDVADWASDASPSLACSRAFGSCATT